MANRPNLEASYRCLGLKPGASANDVKQAYREMAKRWHPDRFAHAPHRQEQARAKFQEINNAYTTLRSAPAVPKSPPASKPQRPRSATRPQPQAAPPPPSPPPPSRPAPAQTASPRQWHLTVPRWAPAVGVAVLTVLAFALGSDQKPPTVLVPASAPPVRSRPQPLVVSAPAPETSATEPSEFFTVGSSKNDVLTIQGAPTYASENLWEYGGSRVYFRNQQVSHWEVWPNAPLKARLQPEAPPEPSVRHFTVGSSKDDVLAIQGSPTRFTNRVWEYGLSRVYFTHGRVTRWEEWRGSPLKAQLFPSEPVTLPNDYFTMGSTKDEVLTIQGSPTRFTNRVWEYGASRIYFRNDRVVRWEEWRGSPLKVRLVPAEADVLLDVFTQE